MASLLYKCYLNHSKLANRTSCISQSEFRMHWLLIKMHNFALLMVMCQSVKVLKIIPGFRAWKIIPGFRILRLTVLESLPQNPEFRNSFIYKKVYLLTTIASPNLFSNYLNALNRLNLKLFLFIDILQCISFLKFRFWDISSYHLCVYICSRPVCQN